ncbi:uncharacterized protein LOC134811251 [Bolinopsis microptera]|uniref:uncharacterized protein LOC134811251 n=1 Tax=Bolinopsis microptera TaxID=2820187 RepID=UPI003078A642
MLMPCRSFDNGSEDVVVHRHHGAGVDDDNSGEDVWSDEDNVEEDQYTQLADFTGDTGIFSSDEEEEEEDSFKLDSQLDTASHAISSSLDIDARIEQALTLPDIDVNRGPGFPEVPPLNLNFNPSQRSEDARRANLALSETDENFIRDSMSCMSIAPPPWAGAIDETNWKDELRKHLAKD